MSDKIDIGSKVIRRKTGETGVCAGRPYTTDSGKIAIMVRWDAKIASPITISSLDKLPHEN